MLTNYPRLASLGQVYTQLEVAVGQFGLDTLTASTRALAGSDATYAIIEGELQQLGAQRDAVAAQMQAALLGAEFGGQPLSAGTAHALIGAGNSLLSLANAFAG